MAVTEFSAELTFDDDDFETYLDLQEEQYILENPEAATDTDSVLTIGQTATKAALTTEAQESMVLSGTEFVNSNLDKETDLTDSIHLYLREIAKFPLLHPSKVVELAVIKDKGFASKTRLETEDKLSKATKQSLEKQVEAGQQAINALVEHNLRLVVNIAKNYWHPKKSDHVPLMDLVQEGSIGLRRAAEKYDHATGYAFSTYATWWIRQAIQRAEGNQKWAIRVPLHQQDSLKKLELKKQELITQLGREPEVEELSGAIGLPPEEVRGLAQVVKKTTSLHAKPKNMEEGEIGDAIADEDALDPFEETAEYLRDIQIVETLESLPDRMRQVLELRYGIRGKDTPAEVAGEPQTLVFTGTLLGISTERVRQIEEDALGKLRKIKEVQNALGVDQETLEQAALKTEKKLLDERPELQRFEIKNIKGVTAFTIGENVVAGLLTLGLDKRGVAQVTGLAVSSAKCRIGAIKKKLEIETTSKTNIHTPRLVAERLNVLIARHKINVSEPEELWEIIKKQKIQIPEPTE